MREIVVTITVTIHMHNMNMAEAIANAVRYLPQEAGRLEIVAHDKFADDA